MSLLGAAGITVALASLGQWIVHVPFGDCAPHLRLQFIGRAECPDASLSELHGSLRRDIGFALVYAALLYLAARLIPEQRHLDKRLNWLNTVARKGPAIAAVADIAENVVLLLATSYKQDDFVVVGSLWPSKVAELVTSANVVAALALVKWTTLAAVVAVLLLRVANLNPDRRAAPVPHEMPERAAPASSELAICCSGGGIRSAAFSLGVLHALDDAGITKDVTRMSAVSGGNYAATGWWLANAHGSATPARTVIEGLLGGRDPLAAEDASVLTWARGDDDSAVRSRVADGMHRFLANGPAGLPRAVLWAGFAVVINLVQLLIVLEVVAWPLGQLLTTDALYPNLATALRMDAPFVVGDQQWTPLVILAATGLALVGSTALFPWRWTKQPLLAGGGALIAIAFLWGAFVVALPWLVVQINSADSKQAFYVGGVSLVTVAGALARVFRNPLRRYAPRLGGAALGVLVLAVFAVAVQGSVVDARVLGSQKTWLSCVAACLLLAYGVDTQMWSLREMYRARLTNSFAPEDYRPPPLRRRVSQPAATRNVGFRWADVPSVQAKRNRDGEKPLPELHICCAASRVGLQPIGASAEAFTISQAYVRHYRATGTITVRTSTYVKSLNSLALEMLKTPAGWLATSGAAFASAMGRHSLGSTNALMAAANVDLGVWLPAPAAVQDPETYERRTRFPPIGLGHLFNEIFGLYSDRDDMIFVSDGGHVENLGLVELLRNGAREIVCIDASGDQPGSFATLREALKYADATLPDDGRLEFDTDELDSSPTPPLTSVYRIPIRQSRKNVGSIYYAKLQAATDQKLTLRQFANSDPRFPNYSTTNQLLDDQQFVFLLFAGHQAGRNLARALFDEAGIAL